MARIKVVRPITLDGYRCDGPECHEECTPDSVGTYVHGAYDAARACSWVVLEDPDHPQSSETGFRDANEARRGFHDWRCAARWAYVKAVEHGDLTSPAPPELRMGVAEYGRAA